MGSRGSAFVPPPRRPPFESRHPTGSGLKVERFPAFIVVDDKGNDFFAAL